MAAESSFQKGFGGGCGLILGIGLAIVAIPLILIGGCIALGIGTMAAAPAVQEARDAARRVEAGRQDVATPTPATAAEVERAKRDEGVILPTQDVGDPSPKQKISTLNPRSDTPHILKERVIPAIDEVATRRLRRFLQEKLAALMEFKSSPDFRYYGFSTRGPYNKWSKEIEEKRREIHLDLTLPPSLRAAVNCLEQVGYEYVSSYGRETDYTRNVLPELRIILEGKVDLDPDNFRYVLWLDNQTVAKLNNLFPVRKEYPFRTWTDITGKYKTVARFRGILNGIVRLEKVDSKDSHLPLERLSDVDREWVENRGQHLVK